jgi:hypothetical protein
MTKRARFLSREMWVGVAVGGVGMTVFFWNTISPRPDVGRLPREGDRVVHPVGFSIVRPGNMKADVREGALVFRVDGGRARLAPGMMVRRLDGKEDGMGFREYRLVEGAFQGRSALVSSGESGKYDAWMVRFERDGVWYEVSLHLPGPGRKAGEMPPVNWRIYLETFRVGE